MIKIMSIFGTRPEAIKMAPLVKEIEEDRRFDSKVCVTAQHREMLDMVLDLFNITPDYDLNIMSHGQTIVDIISKSMYGLDEIIKSEKPDIVLVHGDTTTTCAASQIAFLNKVPVGHVEAGLRSGNKYSPFPEEVNRKITGVIAELHFAPTKGNEKNLNNEGITNNVFITGNTVIDALLQVVEENYVFENEFLNTLDYKNKKICLLTCHRRENWGKPMANIFQGIKEVAQQNKNVEVIYPIHMNPNIRKLADNIFSDMDRIHIIEPLDYQPFVNLINKCYLVMTDSGGIQEEAPALGKPVLVMRTETERPEAVEADTVKVIGVEKSEIISQFSLLLNNKQLYSEMSNAVNPYGDGKACKRIIEQIYTYFAKKI